MSAGPAFTCGLTWTTGSNPKVVPYMAGKGVLGVGGTLTSSPVAPDTGASLLHREHQVRPRQEPQSLSSLILQGTD